MKTTLKRTMAALSAAAIVATSAAVLAVPTSAAGGTATIGTVEVTVEEAKAGQIKVPVSVDNNFVKLSLGAEWDTSELDCTSIKCNSSSLALKFAYSEAYDFAWLPFLSTDADRDGNVLAYDTANGATVAYLIFDIKDADIQPGDVYTITAADTGRDGTKAQFENVNGDGGLTTAVSGAIVVKGEPTTEEPTTEAPVVTTEAATTAAPKATTTAKAATPAATTTKKAAAASTSSPKTGDALPIAGVAVAVAVIGGVALVSKKRK